MMIEALTTAFGLLAFALLFVNGVEILGEKLRLTEFATGAVLAAFLTAVPETLLAVLAPLIGTVEAEHVGIGAVVSAPSITLFLGAPLVLLLSRGTDLGNLELIRRNYIYFAVLLPLPIVFGVINSVVGLGMVKNVFGVALLALFAYLVSKVSREEGDKMEADEELYLARLLRKSGSLPLSLVQTTVGVAGMIVAANFLIQSLSATANPLVYTLIIAPFATCLEETIAAVIWALKGRGHLGLSVLSGENVIQATAVFGIGVLFTDWRLPTVVLPMALLMFSAALVYFAQLPKIRWPVIYGLASYSVYMFYLFMRV